MFYAAKFPYGPEYGGDMVGILAFETKAARDAFTAEHEGEKIYPATYKQVMRAVRHSYYHCIGVAIEHGMITKMSED